MKDDDLKGLVEGVGLDVLDCEGVMPPNPGGAAGENRDGTVPARGRRVALWVVVSEGGRKSGKPSWLGDSGIVSLSGVDPPLAGGPQN